MSTGIALKLVRTGLLVSLIVCVTPNAQAQGREQLSVDAIQMPLLASLLPKTASSSSAASSVRPEKKALASSVSADVISSQLMSSLAQAKESLAGKPFKKDGLLNDGQIQGLERMQKRLQFNGGAKVAFNKTNGTPSLMSAKRLNAGLSKSGSSINNALSEARLFFSENRALMKIDAPADEFRLLRLDEGKAGRKHLRFQQTVNGVPYWGKNVAVHLNKNSDVYFFQGRYEPSLKNFDVTPKMGVAEAKEKVRQKFSDKTVSTLDSELVVYSSETVMPLLTYKVDVVSGMDQRWIYFVNAGSGEIVHRINNIHYAGTLVNASGQDLQGRTQNFNAWLEEGVYYAIDPSFSVAEQNYDPLNINNPFGDTIIFDAMNGDGSSLDYSENNQLNSGWDSAAVSAISNVYEVFNYFKDTFGRDGIDGNNLNNLVSVHFGSGYNNAFWNGAYMVYGDGDDQVFSSLVGCLDIAAHEMSHGVIENTANLIYQNQSGALNESFADIFGAMVDRDDWTLGEDCTVASPGFLRNLADPSTGLSSQPTHMSEYRNLPANEAGDYGGVHINSGIPNRAAYLMADGLSAEGLGASIGRAKTEQIFYNALTTYLVASSKFIDARRATIQAAEDGYGADSEEVTTVTAAWDAVGVVEGASVPSQTGPTDADAVLGNDVVLYMYPDDSVSDTPQSEAYFLYLQGISAPFTGYDPALDFQLVPQPVFANYTRPAIVTTTAGTSVYYVGADFNVYMVDVSLEAYTQLTTTGDIWSLAVSPDGHYMAYTSASSADDNVYVLNLESGVTSVHKVVPVSYQEGTASIVDTVYYADSLSFDYTGNKIVFDALFCQSVVDSDCGSGGGYQYWSIGFLNVTDGSFSYPFSSQNPLFDIGYPAFAYNNNYVVVMDVHDYVDYATAGTIYSEVVSLNIETQALQLVVPIGSNETAHWGAPSFWGGDDFVSVQMPTGGGLSTYRVPISADWSGSYASIESLNDYDAAMPVMHRTGARNISVELQADMALLDFGDVAPDSEKTLSLQLTNIGNVDAEITNIVMSNSAFTDNAVNTTLPRDESITVEVGFVTGVTAGTQAGTLTFHYGVDSELAVSLTGTVNVVSLTDLQSTSASLSFGQLEEGSEKSLSLEISNTGEEEAVITAVAISNSLFTHDLVDTSIPAGGSVVVNVAYSADIVGDQSGVLAIQYGVDNEISISLSALTVEKSSKKSGGGGVSLLVLLLCFGRLVHQSRYRLNIYR